MKNILILISTYNRQDLTGITLDSVARTKSEDSDVVIIDDCSTEYDLEWFKPWGWPVVRMAANAGLGLAARAKYKYFLNSDVQYEFMCALENDTLYCPMFDARLRYRWSRLDTTSRLTILTGYRSVTQKAVAPCAEHDLEEVDGVGGNCHFVDRHAAAIAVERMEEGHWIDCWDRHISRVFERKLAPTHSYVEHLGVHGTGFHGRSTDIALNFKGWA